MYVTYCTARKSLEKPEEGLPPSKRYYSDRIYRVVKRARAAGEPVAILSGKLGLVGENECTPLYDQLLSNEEVLELSKKVAQQLKDKGVTSVTFFADAKAWEEGRAVHRYTKALQMACKEAGTSFVLMFDDESEELNPSDVTFGDISMNKKSFVLMAQDESGLWKTIRTSSFLPDLQIKARSLAKKFPDRKVSIKEQANPESLPF